MSQKNFHGKTEFLLQVFFYAIVVLVVLVLLIGIKILGIPILLSIIIYYCLHGLVNTIESYRINRSLAILFLFFTFGGLIYSIFYFYLPTALEKLSPFLTYWASQFEDPTNNQFVEQIDWLLRVDSEIIQKALPPGEIAKSIILYANSTVDTMIQSIPDIVTYLLITPLISFFLLLDANGIYKSFVSIVPNRYFEMTLMISYKINEQITSYLKGLMIQSSIIAIIGTLGFYFIGLKFFVVFGIFLGFANMIPYLGPILGMIPPAAFALVTGGSLESVMPVIGVVAVCQLVDNILIQPTVIAKSASLHPILVLLAITVGGSLMGIWGMLLAIPILSVLKVTMSVLYNSLREYEVL
jgi:predicted PurR-regulated permease PerM